MIRNYFLVAIRNLTRNKFFSAVNILGLAISMSVAMVIIMLVADQMQYDRHNPHFRDIYRVNSYQVDGKGVDMGGIDNATSPMPLRDELSVNHTAIAKSVRIKRGFGNNWLEVENQNVNIPIKGFFADAEALDFFDLQLQYGDPSTALVEPYSVVLTRKAASKLFGQENPLGLTLKVGDAGTYTVTGVLKETDNKSHLVFEGLASMSTVSTFEGGNALTNWLNFWDGWTYVQLADGRSAQDVELFLDRIFEQHIASAGNDETYKAKFRLQALADITPGPLVNNPIGPSLPWAVVYFLSGLALVIMLTSCFNFTNMSVARSLKRAKEIGVRKVSGAFRWQILTQFLAESVIVAFVSLAGALILLTALKPLMLRLNFARLLMWDLEFNVSVLAVFIGLAVIIGLFAGFFPAIVLSGFQPIKVLKGLGQGKLLSRMGLRKTLLVAQFTISLVFILSVILMYRQLQVFLTNDYGFNMKDNIAVRLNNTSAEELKTELLKYPNVANVAGASHIPAAGETHGNDFKRTHDDKEWTPINTFAVDEDYLVNMQVPLIAGSFFKAENGANNTNFIVVNEEAVKTLHFSSPEEAVGAQVIYHPDSTRKTIAGVIKDYNHSQLFHKIDPLALMYAPDEIRLLQVRYTGTEAKALESIEKAWAAVNPTLKVDYKTVETEIKFFYNTIFGDMVNILGFVAFLAIFIACLGLLGMATYSVETRIKEISIRKVLGASDQTVVVLLSQGFIKLIGIAILIGVPLAWSLNNLWLELIAYRTSFNFTVVASGVAMLLALGTVTIGSQTIRAAFANPVDNLKEE
ncbi:MAG TPA: ABC transporter permease [Chryseosolibacter sp.]|nr:ABC transporter permease [Chryseosolibacter sp.]